MGMGRLVGWSLVRGAATAAAAAALAAAGLSLATTTGAGADGLVPTTTAVSFGTPPFAGDPFTLTATVSPTDGGGTVAFTAANGAASACGAQPLTLVSGSTYKATCTVAGQPAGFFSASAAYSGDTTYAASQSAFLGVIIRKRQSNLTASSSPNPSVVGQPVTFTATVQPTDGGGTVVFNGCGSSPLTQVTGSTYQASCTTSSLPAGTNFITVGYSGDALYQTGYAIAIFQEVDPAQPTTTTLTSSANPSYVGQPVTFAATVSAAGGTPTGSVTFMDGTTPLGSVPLSDGRATLTTTELGPGIHGITATYGGGTGFAPSTSDGVTQNVTGCSSGSPRLLTITPDGGSTGPVYGLFCIGPRGLGTYQQGSVTGFGLVEQGAHVTVVAAIGLHLQLNGIQLGGPGQLDTVTERAPLNLRGTFTVG